MALMAYLRLKGQKQGEIKGGVLIKGREGSIGIIAVTHSIVSPRDAATGQPSGKRQHKPFKFTKELDQSTPLLLQALVNNENLTETRFDFWRANVAGKEVNDYRVEMVNANIASYEVRQGNIRDPDFAKRAI